MKRNYEILHSLIISKKKNCFAGLPSQAIISGSEMTRTASGLILKWHLESYSPIIEYKVIIFFINILFFLYVSLLRLK